MQQCHVVDDIVVSPLGEGTVDVAERQQSVFGHAARESDGMPLSDADVEGALRHLLHHDVHRAARRHGRRHADDAVVLAGQFQQRLAEDILESGWLVGGVLDDALTGLRVKFARRMPDSDILLGRGVAMSFLSVQVQQLRSLHVLQLSQDAHQLLDVVAVERPEVADVHALEHVLLVRDGRLDGVRQTDDALAAVIVQQSFVVQPA